MKKGFQRAFAITIAVIMMLSMVALFFPLASISQPAPAPTATFDTIPADTVPADVVAQ